MIKEMQIEEMANEIVDVWKNKCQTVVCKGCKFRGVNENKCQETLMADHLYNKGYRKQEWISVDERLPDIDELCLLSMENRITKYRWVTIGYYHTNYDEYVTHWMPLPQPPMMKGGAE